MLSLEGLIFVVLGIWLITQLLKRRWSSVLTLLAIEVGVVVLIANTPETKSQPKTAVVVAANRTDAPATAEPTEAPTPKPDRHDERVRIQTYWNHVINSLAMANEATVAASSAVQGGDLVSASHFLKQGQEAAMHAKEMSQSEVPDGYNEVGSTLFTASDTFANAVGKESDFLDTQTPSVAADALEQRQRAQSEIEDAQHVARMKYVDLGGKIDDLSSFADAANAADQLLKMFTH